MAAARALGKPDAPEALLRAVERLHEQNPVPGTRGVRLGFAAPGLYEMQVRAVAEAAAARVRAGGKPRVEILIPLVGDVRELDIMAGRARRILDEVTAAAGFPCEIGTMIELPGLIVDAVAAGRATRPDLGPGVCGDPESIGFFHEAGPDYVSCSPFRVPVARADSAVDNR